MISPSAMGQEDFFAGIYLLERNSCRFDPSDLTPSQAADLEAWQADGSSCVAT